jgi:hypothetical protein
MSNIEVQINLNLGTPRQRRSELVNLQYKKNKEAMAKTRRRKGKNGRPCPKGVENKKWRKD